MTKSKLLRAQHNLFFNHIRDSVNFGRVFVPSCKYPRVRQWIRPIQLWRTHRSNANALMQCFRLESDTSRRDTRSITCCNVTPYEFSWVTIDTLKEWNALRDTRSGFKKTLLHLHLACLLKVFTFYLSLRNPFCAVNRKAISYFTGKCVKMSLKIDLRGN